MVGALENRGHFMELLLLSGTSFYQKDKSAKTFRQQTIKRIHIWPLISELSIVEKKNEYISVHFVDEERLFTKCRSFQNSGSSLCGRPMDVFRENFNITTTNLMLKRLCFYKYFLNRILNKATTLQHINNNLFLSRIST